MPSAASRFLLALLAALLTSTSSPAQALPTFKVDTHLVNTAVSVRDGAGRIMQGLTQNDFEVVEDGAPQAIKFFAHDAQVPLSLGLIIDVSSSQDRFIKDHAHDIQMFLKQVMQPQDTAFAVCFGNHLRLVSDTTTQVPDLIDGIERFDSGKGHFPELGPEEKREEGTALFDAAYFSTLEKLNSTEHRRKALILFTDGEDNSSEHDLLDAIGAAQDNDVLVYAVRYTELHHGKMNARDKYGVRTLAHLSGRTGGIDFDAHTTDLSKAFDQIAGELRSLYEIAYQSTNKARDGSYRKAVVQVKRDGMVVRAKPGYYAR